MLELLACPEPGCDVVAEVTSRWMLASTHGLVEHIQTRCLNGHVLTPLAEAIPWE